MLLSDDEADVLVRLLGFQRRAAAAAAIMGAPDPGIARDFVLCEAIERKLGVDVEAAALHIHDDAGQLPGGVDLNRALDAQAEMSRRMIDTQPSRLERIATVVLGAMMAVPGSDKSWRAENEASIAVECAQELLKEIAKVEAPVLA
jgi:hypothetical protein